MTPSEQIDEQITGFGDWRGEVLSRLRLIIRETDPEITEAWKWRTAIWEHNGLICGFGGFKNHVALNFFMGAHLTDSHRLFSGDGSAKNSRAIRFDPGDVVNARAVADLISQAVAYNIAAK